jgi:phosphoglucan, water dikinase
VKGADFTTPPGVVVPFGVPEEALALDPKREKVYLSLAEKVDSLSGRALEDLLGELRERVRGIRVPDRILSGLEKGFRGNDLLMVRSSSNCEDLEKISGAGLYESVAAVRLPEAAHAIREVWASIWTRRAVLSRRSSGIPHGEAHMAVLIQRMVFPELSFVLHTLNPLRHDADQVYMELAVGLGETLVSGRTPGAPYRMTYDKKERKVRILSFASFSKGLWPDPPRGTKERRVDYSTIRFSVDPEFRRDLVGRLGRIGDRVETAFGSPQDIEGAFSEETIYLVQTRPQQGALR